MKNRMNEIALGIAMLLLGLIVSSGPAYAISYDLNNWNDSVLDASTDKVTVDVTTTAGITKLIFTWVSGNSGLTAIGIDKLGYESTVGCCGAGSTAGWSFDSDGTPPSHQMNGFGSFLSVADKAAATDLTITLYLTGDASLALNGAEDFSAHVRYGNNCSGFVSGRTESGTDGTSSCGGSTSVPEPSSLILLGSGLAALGLWGRKSLKV